MLQGSRQKQSSDDDAVRAMRVAAGDGACEAAESRVCCSLGAVRQTTGYARLRAVRVRRPAKYQCIIYGSEVNVQRRTGVEAIRKSQ